ncbi:Fibronectin type-III domain-containing protein 3a, partial [Ophiophagus hannah]
MGPPPLEATPILNEVPLLPHMVNGDTTQQVILVQVNPGETFTIRTEDGHIQCIQGPAHVPMMSPNGSVPPIFVPPGYVSQVVEENGVRKVIVMPHSTEFHPSMHPPPPHVPHYIHPHPALLPHPPHPVYPPVPGTGEIPPQFIHQHPPPPSPHLYQDQESRSHSRANFVQRDERTLKMQEHLKKRLKDRQATGHTNNKANSPPSSPHKANSSSSGTNVQNGYGKGQSGTVGQIKQKHIGKTRGSPIPSADSGMGESDTESRKSEELLSFSKPTVSEIQARSAVISWNAPAAAQNEEMQSLTPEAFTFEVAISNSGKNGKFKSLYSGEDVTFTLSELRPATDYHVRVSASGHSTKESVSELVSFTTESCEPDPPAAPKVVNKTKNSLTLQWKSSNDNGSKITSYLLEWDEQHKVTKLSPSTKYAFRLAAKNDIGMSGFGETLVCFTIGVVPPPPLPPQLSKAGVNGLSLKWGPPSGMSSDDSLTYILEMEEDGSDYGFQAGYNGDELSCTLSDLRRNTSYKFRLFAHNTEGKSGPSEVVEYSTCPDKPGPPSKPTVKGKIHSHNVKVTWDPPKDTGGSDVSSYILEISEASAGSKWETAYKGSTREHVCAHLKPGISYRLKVSCVGRGGQSQPSDILTVQTSAVPPGPCHPPCLSGKAKPKEIALQWEVANSDQEEHRQAYRGQALECTLGPYSEKAEISTAPGPPDPCSIPLLMCKTATCIVATWESPPCNGAEVSEYRLEWGQMEGSMHIVYTGPLLCYEVKGLSPATTYYCRVQISSAVVLIGWKAMENFFQLDFFPPVLPSSHTSDSSSPNINFLSVSLPDRIRIQAFNSLGTGPFSPSIKAKTKPLPPDPPHLECVVFSYQSLKLKWGEGPSRTLIANPTQFNLQMEDRLGRLWRGRVSFLSGSSRFREAINVPKSARHGEPMKKLPSSLLEAVM